MASRKICEFWIGNTSSNGAFSSSQQFNSFEIVGSPSLEMKSWYWWWLLGVGWIPRSTLLGCSVAIWAYLATCSTSNKCWFARHWVWKMVSIISSLLLKPPNDLRVRLGTILEKVSLKSLHGAIFKPNCQERKNNDWMWLNVHPQGTATSRKRTSVSTKTAASRKDETKLEMDGWIRVQLVINKNTSGESFQVVLYFWPPTLSYPQKIIIRSS